MLIDRGRPGWDPAFVQNRAIHVVRDEFGRLSHSTSSISPTPHGVALPQSPKADASSINGVICGDLANSRRSSSRQQEPQLSLQRCTLGLCCSCFIAGLQGQLVPSVTIMLDIHQSCPKFS